MSAVAVCLLLLPDPVRLVGEYDGVGTDVAGKAYRTQVRIAADGDAYRVWWTAPDGKELMGVGLQTGRQLAVSWTGRAGDGKVWLGLTVYQVRPDGTLDGRWTMFGARGVVRAETLRPAA